MCAARCIGGVLTAHVSGDRMVTGSDSLRVYTSKVTLIRGEHDSEDEGSDDEHRGSDVEGRTLDEELDAAEGAAEAPPKRKGSLERRQSRFEVDPWTLIWERRMAKPVYHLKFSPDGNFFAAAGKVRGHLWASGLPPA